MEHFLRLGQWWLSKYWRVCCIGTAAFLVLCRVSAEHLMPYVSATARDDESIVVHRVKEVFSSVATAGGVVERFRSRVK